MATGTSKPAPEKAAAPKPTAPKDTVLVDTAEAHTDRVAMVSRDKNGNPDQSSDFALLTPDDASDEEKRRAENRPEDNQIGTGEPKGS